MNWMQKRTVLIDEMKVKDAETKKVEPRLILMELLRR